MALLTIKNNLKTLEQTSIYRNRLSLTKVIQGDIHSDRIYKYLTLIKRPPTPKHPARKVIRYGQWKHHGDGDTISQAYITKIVNWGSKLDRREYLRLRFDESGELIYYEDGSGNHWDKEWGVEMPYDMDKIIQICGKKYMGAEIRNPRFYTGNKIRKLFGSRQERGIMTIKQIIKRFLV
jgi:hypothetical protein